ncbi:hypothetical protein PSQ33_006584 [Pseudomonas aeruginosa]|nr:hypothetical protein [Pseudomonas aeruginosa]EKL8567583.1 hypothetical protein [Pseudomonas aeruginosa]EKW7863100.1 hypothetical protein [Pseudomonas aeruginosa]MDT8223107.1 hypothetical protein [Pseudomonas aeruginosa]HCF0197584.1 hypothetical protein [Pseudomonas aeruginosa]
MIEEVRKRDAERFALETAGGLFAGRALVLGNIEALLKFEWVMPRAG